MHISKLKTETVIIYTGGLALFFYFDKLVPPSVFPFNSRIDSSKLQREYNFNFSNQNTWKRSFLFDIKNDANLFGYLIYLLKNLIFYCYRRGRVAQNRWSNLMSFYFQISFKNINYGPILDMNGVVMDTETMQVVWASYLFESVS